MARRVNITEERTELTAVDKMSGVVRQAQGQIRELRSGIDTVRNALAAVGVTVGTGAMLKLFADTVKATAALDDMAEATGASVESLSKLQTVARIGGQDFGGLTQAIGRMVRGLNGTSDDGQKAGQALAFLGIQAREANGRFRDTGQILIDVAGKLAQYEDGGNKVALVQDLLGRGAAAYLPLLKDLAEEGDLQARVTAKQAEEAERLEKGFNRLKVAFDDAKRELVLGMLPALTDLVEKLNDASRASGGLMAGLGTMALAGGGNPLDRLTQIDQELNAARVGQGGVANTLTLGVSGFFSGMSESRLLNERDYIYAQLRRARQGLGEDAAGNVGPAPAAVLNPLNYQTTSPADLKRAEDLRKQWRDIDAAIAEAVVLGKDLGDQLSTRVLEPSERAARAWSDIDASMAQLFMSRSSFEAENLQGVLRPELSTSPEERRRQEEDLWAWRISKAEEFNAKFADGARRNQEILAQSITDGIMQGFDRGEDFFENFARRLQSAVLTITIQPVMLGLANAIAAPISGIFQAGTNSVLSSLGLGLPGSSGGGLMGIGGFGGFGSTIGLDAAGSAALIESGTLGAAGAGMEAAALGGWGAGIGAALPWIGGGLLLGGALGLFGDRKPKQSTAKFTAGFGEDLGPGAFTSGRYLTGRHHGAALDAFSAQQAAMEQNLIRNLGLDEAQIAAVNASLGGTYGTRYVIAPGGKDSPVDPASLQQIQAARLQAISSTLGRSIEELTSIMAMSAEQWAQAIDQLEQAVRQAEDTLAQNVRGLPGALGITGLEDFQRSLAIGESNAPLDRLAAARGFYEQTLARALGGDLDAARAFPGVAQDLLGIGRDTFASGAGYQDLFREVNVSLQQVLERQRGLQADILRDVPTAIIESSRDQVAELRRGFTLMVEKLEAVETELKRMQAA